MRFVVLAMLLSASALSNAQTVHDAVTPTIGVAATSAVGEPVYEKDHYTSVPAYEIQDSFVGKNVFATVVLTPGEKFMPIASKHPDKVKLKACHSNSIESNRAGSYDACLYDDDGDGTFDRFGGNEIQGGKVLPHPFKYTVTEFVEPTADAVKQVVIFLGSTKDSLRFSYREFVNDMARPAFTEEYTFPLAATYPQPIAFKGVKLTVTAVDGAGLHYRIDGSK